MSPTGSSFQKPLRLWPAAAAAPLLVSGGSVALLAGPGALVLDTPVATIGMLGSVLSAVAIVLWWLLLSRARWPERVGAAAAMALAIVLARLALDPSIAGAGMGFLYYIYAIQTTSLALAIWAIALRARAGVVRTVAMMAALLAGSGVWTLVRTGGIGAGGTSDLHWRWTPTPEERLLAEAAPMPPPLPPAEQPAATIAPPVVQPAAAAPQPAATQSSAAERLEASAPPEAERPPVRVADWPGFRGPHRDGVVTGARIETEWSVSPPVEVWRRPIGPGWSSFAVDAGLLFTQEQRGDDEVVAAYRASSGEPVWMHRDAIRFYESNAGAGPRATPTVHDGRIYAMGATGVLNVLDAESGRRLWSRNAATDAGREVPGWGIASSPIVTGGLVVVAITGQLVAYDTETGEPRWFGPTGGGGYSSPHLATIDGVPQVLLLRGGRTVSVGIADGAVLWDHVWQPGVSIVQPAFTGDGDVLVAGGDSMGGTGIRRLHVSEDAGVWRVEERWTSRGLKPYFNDFVVHQGHAFGFDGSILSCIDLSDGERKWKGGRYGNGQMVLLSDQGLLLVLSEDGGLALVRATPDGFAEVARAPGIEGKTWNHPVIAGDLLFVRNAEEMAAFRLAPGRQ